MTINRLMKNIIIYLLIQAIGFVSIAQDNSLLWEITGNGLDQPSYLYGTIHFICPGDFSIGEEVKDAFSESKQLYLEIDFDNPSMMAEMQKAMIMGNGKTIKDFLDEADCSIIDNYLKNEVGMGLAMLQSMKPFAIMSVMIIPMVGCQPKSFEAEFMQMAASQQIGLHGLETIACQIGVFDSIPYQLQYDMLVDMVEDKGKGMAEFQQMVDAYKEANLGKLLEMLNNSGWDYKGYEDLLIYNRNKNWVPAIEKAARQMPSFFAVGAGHLPGQKGLIQLLRDEGYSVKPIINRL